MMKKILKTSLPLALILITSMTTFADTLTYKLQVDGLACPFCAFGIEKQLGKIDGVDQLDTDIKAGVILLTMKNGVFLDETAAKQAVERAGFTLRGLEHIQSSSQN
jgi:mercuric ion binding protein